MPGRPAWRQPSDSKTAAQDRPRRRLISRQDIVRRSGSSANRVCHANGRFTPLIPAPRFLLAPVLLLPLVLVMPVDRDDE